MEAILAGAVINPENIIHALAVAKACIECCRSIQQFPEEVARIGKRLTLVVASAHQWAALCGGTEGEAKLAGFHCAVENMYRCLQSVSLSQGSSWTKKLKVGLHSFEKQKAIVEAENHLNAAISDLQIAQSTSLLSKLDVVTICVSKILDQMGQMKSQLHPTRTIQEEFDIVLNDMHVHVPEVAVQQPEDEISFSPSIIGQSSVQSVPEDSVQDENPGAKETKVNKILFKPNKAELSAITLDASILDFVGDPENLLGGGGFAEVYKGLYDQKPVAIKRLIVEGRDLVGVSEAELARDIERLAAEALIMQRCSLHPNVVTVVGCVLSLSEVDRPVIAMELMSITLFDALRDKECREHMTNVRLLHLMKGTAGAVEFLHLQGIVHHDIKSLNILLDSGLTIAKLADFGEAKVKGLNATKARHTRIMSTTRHGGAPIAGTLVYQAPELLAEEVVESSRVSDMYSFGVTVWECLTKKAPHEGKKENSVYVLAISRKDKPMLRIPSNPDPDLSVAEKTAWKSMKRVAQSCLSRNRDERPNASIVVAIWHQVESPEMKRVVRKRPVALDEIKMTTAGPSPPRQSGRELPLGRNKDEVEEKVVEREGKGVLSFIIRYKCALGFAVLVLLAAIIGGAAAAIYPTNDSPTTLPSQIPSSYPSQPPSTHHPTMSASPSSQPSLSPVPSALPSVSNAPSMSSAPSAARPAVEHYGASCLLSAGCATLLLL